mmetsp:Transcript_12717/g.46955  ORF Transcript_12717/g.46955 Transcript_12717/m.46955 type:complete len:323 (-) Transcript_12717:17-985(-)
MRAGLFPEAHAEATVLQRQLRLLHPLAAVEAADGLLGGGDQILLGVLLASDLVQSLVKLAQLGHAGHDLLVHHVGRLQQGEAPGPREGDGVVDDRLVEQHAGIREEVALVPGHLGAPAGLVASDHVEQLMVRNRLAGRRPALAGRRRPVDEGVIVGVLVVAGGHVLGNDVADLSEELVSHLRQRRHRLLQLRHVPVDGLLLGHHLFRRLLLRLVYLGQLLLQITLVLPTRVDCALRRSPGIVCLDDLVHQLLGGIASALRLADLVRVSAGAIGSEEVDVQRHGLIACGAGSWVLLVRERAGEDLRYGPSKRKICGAEEGLLP